MSKDTTIPRGHAIALHTATSTALMILNAVLIAIWAPLGAGALASTLAALREQGQHSQKLRPSLGSSLEANLFATKQLVKTPWAILQWAAPGVIVFFAAWSLEIVFGISITVSLS